jgi:hypothetical protein
MNISLCIYLWDKQKKTTLYVWIYEYSKITWVIEKTQNNSQCNGILGPCINKIKKYTKNKILLKKEQSVVSYIDKIYTIKSTWESNGQCEINPSIPCISSWWYFSNVHKESWCSNHLSSEMLTWTLVVILSI